MDDKRFEQPLGSKAADKFQNDTNKLNFSVGDAGYLVEHIIVGLWVLTIPLLVGHYYILTIWLSYSVFVIITLAAVLHFRAYKRPFAWVLAGALAVSGFIAITNLSNAFQANQLESEIHGWLTPADAPTPLVCPNVPKDALLVVLGQSAIWTSRRQKGLTVLEVCGEPLMTVHRGRGGKLLINASVFDGRIMAQIVNNEFTLNPNNMFRMNRPDSHTLTVYGQFGREKLNIRFLNPHAIRVTGTFGYPACDRRIVVGENSIKLLPQGMTFKRLFSGNAFTGFHF